MTKDVNLALITSVTSLRDAVFAGHVTVEDLCMIIPGGFMQDGCFIHPRNSFVLVDPSGYDETVWDVENREEAIAHYLSEFPTFDGGTYWVRFTTYLAGINEAGQLKRVEELGHRTAIHPDEPNCCEGHTHEWHSPESLGGCKENPGVWGHGGGMIIHELCKHCGFKRITDTWAQDECTGEEGLTSIKYEYPTPED